jgi:two-component system, cell cycle response regulator
MNGQILIVDDVATNRVVYRARLAAAFYEPLLASDGAGCLSIAQDVQPDLILLDLNLPDIPGTEVLKRLRAAPRTRNIPVIVLTAARDCQARLAAFSAGADDVLTKPASEATLLARVRNLLRARGSADFPVAEELVASGLAETPHPYEPRATIALVSSSAEGGEGWLRDLASQTRDRLMVMSRSQALAEAGAGTSGSKVPDVFVIHDDVGGLTGSLRLLSELKSHAATRHSAVCLMGSPQDGDGSAIAFDLGADDVVDPAITSQELVLRMRSLLRRKRLHDRQRASVQDNLRLAMIDPLTGLHNRRYAMPRLGGIAAESEKEGVEFAVMVVDLDNFKQVNDQFGHAVGDHVLMEVAQRLTANLRENDLLARIGGEEFLVVLPSTPMKQARRVAERLCEAVEELPICLASGQFLTVTVSIGVAVSGLGPNRDHRVEALVEQADLALLESKKAGRNQVTYRLTAA